MALTTTAFATAALAPTLLPPPAQLQPPPAPTARFARSTHRRIPPFAPAVAAVPSRVGARTSRARVVRSARSPARSARGMRAASSGGSGDGTAVTAATSSTASPSAHTATAPDFRRLHDAQRELVDRTSVFVLDCDGVVWRGDSVIPGVPATLDYLRSLGKRCFFVTNNSTKSRAGYLNKFTSLGLDVSAEEILSSSFAAAAYLESQNFAATGKKVYVLGEVGIDEELDAIGVPHLGGPADSDKQPPMGPGDKMEVDPDVGAVVVGFDRRVNYYKIQYANLCIREHGAEFIATNTDAVTHLTDAQEWAGNGSMVGAIRGCTQQEPTVVGKPSPLMIDYIADKFGIAKEEICIVGDRLDTDVLFGKNNGTRAVLALSGVTTEKVMRAQADVVPDFYIDSIAELAPAR